MLHLAPSASFSSCHSRSKAAKMKSPATIICLLICSLSLASGHGGTLHPGSPETNNWNRVKVATCSDWKSAAGRLRDGKTSPIADRRAPVDVKVCLCCAAGVDLIAQDHTSHLPTDSEQAAPAAASSGPPAVPARLAAMGPAPTTDQIQTPHCQVHVDCTASHAGHSDPLVLSVQELQHPSGW